MMMLMLSLAAALAAPCSEDPEADVKRSAALIEVADADLDIEGVQAYRLDLDRALSCLTEPIERDTALAAHRASSAAFFAEGNWKAAGLSLAAVRMLAKPGWRPPIADSVHPMVVRWAELADFRETLVPLPERALPPLEVKNGAWFIDGEQTSVVPSNRAFVAQAVTADDGVIWSGRVLDPASLPGPWAAVVEPRVTDSMKRARKVGTPIAGGLALLGVGLAAGGLLTRAQVDSDMTSAEVRALKNRAGALNAGAGIGAGLGIVGGGLAWAVRW